MNPKILGSNLHSGNGLLVGSECRQFQLDLAAADGSGDVTQAFELASALEPLLTAEEEGPGHEPAATAAGVDASGAVKNLLVPVDVELSQLLRSLANTADAAASGSSACYARYAASMTCMAAGGSPTWLAVCDNTAGYRALSGRLVKAAEGSGQAVPARLLLAAFNRDAELQRRDHLAAMSLDGRVRLKTFSSGVDWGIGVWGLHCDSGRQLVYISQCGLGVCVADLACTVLHRITAASLGRDPTGFLVSGLSGTPDKLFVYNHRQRTVLAVGKKDLTLHCDASLGPGSDTFDGGLAASVEPSLVLACDWQSACLQRVCLSSGLRLPPVPATGLAAPYAVAIDNRRGVVFVSDFEHRVVRVLLASTGRDCQSPLIGSPGESQSQKPRQQQQQQQKQQQFAAPCGLAIAEPSGQDGAQLFVADSAQNRIVVYALI